MRYIVIADVHGNTQLLKNAVYHSDYDHTLGDKIIFAGDFCDIGDNTVECQKMLEDWGAEILLGNHEIAHMFGHSITPYDYRLDSVPGLVQKWINKSITGVWKIATAIEVPSGDDIIITHAGVSEMLGDKLNLRGLTAKQAADRINQKFMDEIRFEFDTKLLGPRNHWLVYDELLSPVWYRPFEEWYYGSKPGAIMPFPYRQIAGHTPMECYSKEQLEKLDKIGFTLIDPYQGGRMDLPNYCMYAIVEDGKVTRVESESN